MTSYNINIRQDGKNEILDIGFGEPAQNDQIVRDANQRLNEMINLGILEGGQVLRISGPASLPVAFVIAHGVNHLYGAIAVYDPKLQKYVVSITHSPNHKLGDLID